MGYVKSALIGTLVMGVIILAITVWQYDLFSNYSAQPITSKDPGHLGKNLSYVDQSSYVLSLAQNISNKVNPQASNQTTSSSAGDFLAVFYLTKDIAALGLNAFTAPINFIGAFVNELGFQLGIDLSIFWAFAFGGLLVIGALAAAGILLGRDF